MCCYNIPIYYWQRYHQRERRNRDDEVRSTVRIKHCVTLIYAEYYVWFGHRMVDGEWQIARVQRVRCLYYVFNICCVLSFHFNFRMIVLFYTHKYVYIHIEYCVAGYSV